MNEPSNPEPGPYATPHSAPPRPVKYDPGPLPPAQGFTGAPQNEVEPEDLTPEEQRRRDIADFLDTYERIAPEAVRRDGWTPFLRKLFLQTIADTGKVSTACAYTQMSRSAAYALARRDRVFAAGWEAADHFARRPVADHAREQMFDGITETVTRSDGVTVTRHRYDTRLTIAVLNRLDKRCDRAEERGSVHLAAMRNWDEYLRLVGEGDDQSAEALLDRPVVGGGGAAQNRPDCQLPERANPIPIGDPPGSDPSESCWRDDDGTWMTSFPPPPGFDGHENCPFDGFNYYERACTAEEVELIEAHEAAAAAEERAQAIAFAEAQRDRWFAKLRRELGRDETRPPLN